MSDTIIQVEGLGKKYTINQEGEHSYTALRDVIAGTAGRLFTASKRKTRETFWALEDISFSVRAGEAVGIIGRNGAGKSTLLKLISRITEPTTGRIEINGRVASLLEVGTGFHPELTGRENIFLNGTLLGMKRAEIRRKFDEIVEFAGVERFLDTPVKRYSSGMYVRLAFAIAAHLEPEILIVDEILAVGDTAFQKKCLGKMDEVSRQQGRTVLFVSHQLGTIAQLCTHGLLLENGRLVNDGSIQEVIDDYLDSNRTVIPAIERTEPIEGIHFRSIYMCSADLAPATSFAYDQPVQVRVRLRMPGFNPEMELAMRLVDRHKQAVFTIHEKLAGHLGDPMDLDLLVTVPQHFVTPGKYSWVMCINHPGVQLYDLQDDILPFTIFDTGSAFARYDGSSYGSVFAQYSVNRLSS